MPARWLDPEEQAAWRGWLALTTLLKAQLARDLQSDSGLSDADFAILVQLSEREGHQVRMSELADELQWSRSRVSHQVARMEARGLLARTECPSDARGAFAELTDAGLEVIRQAAPLHVASVRRHFIDLLDRDQLAALSAIADTVVADLRRHGALHAAEATTGNGSGPVPAPAQPAAGEDDRRADCR